MGTKLYIKDDTGRRFTNLEWSSSDTKELVGVLSNRDYLNVLQAHFRLNINELNRVQHYSETRQSDHEYWCSIRSLLSDVKHLKHALQRTSDPFGPNVFVDLNYTAIATLGSHADNPNFSDDYFVYGGFYGDLEDLERLLYYLLHSGAKQVHLYCA